MGDLVTSDRANCESVHSGDCGGSAVERRELYFERSPIRVDVNHGTHVTNFESLGRYRLGQDDSIVLFDHFERLLLAGICRHQSRRFLAGINDPNRPDVRLTALLSVHRQPAVNNIFLAVRRFHAVHDVAIFGDVAQRLHQEFRVIAREPE